MERVASSATRGTLSSETQGSHGAESSATDSLCVIAQCIFFQDPWPDSWWDLEGRVVAPMLCVLIAVRTCELEGSSVEPYAIESDLRDSLGPLEASLLQRAEYY